MRKLLTLGLWLAATTALADSTGNIFSSAFGSTGSVSATSVYAATGQFGGATSLNGALNVSGTGLAIYGNNTSSYHTFTQNASGLLSIKDYGSGRTDFLDSTNTAVGRIYSGGSTSLSGACFGPACPSGQPRALHLISSGTGAISDTLSVNRGLVSATIGAALEVSGAISATRFIGDGSSLTGISGGGGTLNFISAYTTSVVSSGQIIAPNANTMVSMSLSVSSSAAFGAYLANSKFTPTNGSPKRYAVNANIMSVKPGAVLSDALQLNIVKNNFSSYTVCKKNFPSTTIYESIGCFAIVELNGSTDYIQLVMKNNDATNNAIVGFSSQPQIYIQQLD